MDSDYVRQALEAKRQELLSSTCDRHEILIDKVADELETMQRQWDREIAISKLDREAKLLRTVEAALARLVDDAFGLCLNCERPIAEKRLRAIPWAAYCVSCQEAIDRQPSNDEAADTRDKIGRAA